MLYLTRKPGEAIVINESVEVTVISVSGKSVKLGFSFPDNASVLRKEVYERIQAENQSAAKSAAGFAGFTRPLDAKTLPPLTPPTDEDDQNSDIRDENP